MAKKKKKQWTKEECRRRYVEGERIGQRALSEQSGRQPTVIARWCREDNWVQQRERYVRELCAKTQAKTIEKTSERLSERYAQLAEEHLIGYKSARSICLMKFAKVHRNKKRVGEDRAIEDLNATDFQRFVNSYDKIVMGERLVTGMAYEQDINLAYEVLVKAGYEIFDPTEREKFESDS